MTKFQSFEDIIGTSELEWIVQLFLDICAVQ